MANDIEALRGHLFDALQGIKDGTIDADKAKLIGDVSQVVINSAKVEVDYIRANGGGGSNFISADVKQISATPTGTKTVNGASTVHKLR